MRHIGHSSPLPQPDQISLRDLRSAVGGIDAAREVGQFPQAEANDFAVSEMAEPSERVRDADSAVVGDEFDEFLECVERD